MSSLWGGDGSAPTLGWAGGSGYGESARLEEWQRLVGTCSKTGQNLGPGSRVKKRPRSGRYRSSREAQDGRQDRGGQRRPSRKTRYGLGSSDWKSGADRGRRQRLGPAFINYAPNPLTGSLLTDATCKISESQTMVRMPQRTLLLTPQVPSLAACWTLHHKMQSSADALKSSLNDSSGLFCCGDGTFHLSGLSVRSPHLSPPKSAQKGTRAHCALCAGSPHPESHGGRGCLFLPEPPQPRHTQWGPPGGAWGRAGGWGGGCSLSTAPNLYGGLPRLVRGWVGGKRIQLVKNPQGRPLAWMMGI